MTNLPTLRSSAPAAYAHLLSGLFDEPRASCDACPMCNTGDGEVAGTVTFSPSTRCCTYYPPLPNFLLGALLADRSPAMEEGRLRIRERIERRVAVTPHWIKAPPVEAALHAATIGQGFGRSLDLLCPYYSAGNCTIWRYRDAVCSTYFCRHVGGARARTFWASLRDYMLRVEVRLASWAASTVDPSVIEPSAEQNAEELLSDEVHERAFGSWAGRVEAFYIACAEALGTLDREGFARVVDETPRAKKLLEQVRVDHALLTRPGPVTHLVLNRRLRRAPAPGGVRVTADSPWDPLYLSEGLARILLSLKAEEPLEDALARIQREQGVELPASLLDQLRAFDILVPPAGAEASKP